MRPHDEWVSGVEVGVTVTLYDDYQFLGECLGNLVRAATSNTLRICLCIDESRYDENARLIVAGLSERYGLLPEIAFNNRGGPGKARNEGIRYLLERYPKIEYFFFMDADNYLGEGTIDVLVDCLESAPADVVYTYQDVIKFGTVNCIVRLDVPFERWRLLNQFYGETGNLVRASVFRESADFFFDESRLLAGNTGEDVEFYRRLSRCFKGRYCPGTRFYYRTKFIHRDSVYWSMQDVLLGHMKSQNERLYAEARAEFMGKRFWEPVALDNDGVDAFIDRYKEDWGFTSRGYLELCRPLLVLGATHTELERFEKSSTAGVLVAGLFNESKQPIRLVRLKASSSGRLGVRVRRVRWGSLRLDTDFAVALAPPESLLRYFHRRRSGLRAVEIVTLTVPQLPSVGTITKRQVERFASRIVQLESTKQPLVDFSQHERVAKMPNHGEWLRDRTHADPAYLGSQLRRLGGGDTSPRICFVATGDELDRELLGRIQACRDRFDGARIDLLVTSSLDVPRLTVTVDLVIPLPMVAARLRARFLRRLLANYEIVHIADSPDVWGNLRPVVEGDAPPKIVARVTPPSYVNGLRVGVATTAPAYTGAVAAFTVASEALCDYLVARQVQAYKVVHIPEGGVPGDAFADLVEELLNGRQLTADYRGFTVEGGHRVLDQELMELRELADRVRFRMSLPGAHADRQLDLHRKRRVIGRMRKALAKRLCVGTHLVEPQDAEACEKRVQDRLTALATALFAHPAGIRPEHLLRMGDIRKGGSLEDARLLAHDMISSALAEGSEDSLPRRLLKKLL